MFSYRIDENLKLVLPIERSAEEIYHVVRENLEELKLWMPWATDDYSIDSARDFIKRNLTSLADGEGFNAGIALENEIVGAVGFHHLDSASKSVQMGYWLAKKAQGQGLMTRCCRVLIDYAFADLGLNRIQINCNVENVKSRAIPERLDFKLEGIHRQAKFENNRFTDWAIYAMLANEWKGSE